MKLIAFEIPDAHHDQCDWLEQIVCTGDLRRLIAQLHAVHGTPKQEFSLDEVLGDQSDETYESGLRALGTDQLSCLLRHPALLLELQEEAICRGTTYWDRRFQGLPGALPEPVKMARASAVYSPAMLVGLALAAVLLLAVGGLLIRVQFQNGSTVASNTNPPVNSTTAKKQGWGWANDASTPQDVTPQDYLLAIAGGAEAWKNKPPTDPASLKQRLTEFRNGCQRLIEMQHSALPELEQTWLRQNCLRWKEEIESQIATAGQREFETAADQAESLAMDIANMIRDHVEQMNA